MSSLRRYDFVFLALLSLLAVSGCSRDPSANPSSAPDTDSKSTADPAEAAVELSQDQLKSVKIESVATHSFRVEKEAIGNVAYDKVTDPSAKILVANVTENDVPLVHEGQSIQAKVEAYPDRGFDGKISELGGSVYDSGGNPAIDPNIHRVIARCEIADPNNELFPGMLASVTIQVGEPIEAIAIPINGVVRNGDGTMAAWVTTDRHKFVERIVKIGAQQDGQYQVLEGLQKGELAVTDGAVFLSNILQAPPSD